MTPTTPVVEAGYGTGFSMVGGFGVGRAGACSWSTIPALLDPAEPLGTGRMFRVGLPAAHVTGTTATNDRTPTFAVVGDGTIECLLRGPPERRGAACPADGQVTPATELADGSYTLSVRAAQGGVTGIPEAHRFVVDTAAPAIPVIDRPAQGAAAPLRPWFAFDAEEGASFACRFDDEADFTACSPGRTRTFTENGAHTLTILARDRAGNESPDSAPRAFTVDAGLAIEMPLPWGPGPVRTAAPPSTPAACTCPPGRSSTRPAGSGSPTTTRASAASARSPRRVPARSSTRRPPAPPDRARASAGSCPRRGPTGRRRPAHVRRPDAGPQRQR